MSAFIVTHETINAAVSAFHPLDGPFIPCEQSDWLGRRLWDMNHEAVRQRYPNDPEEARERFSFRPHTYTPFERLAALRCLRYQCSEGNVPQLQLFHELTRKIERLALEIINELPEYEAVAWNLPDPASYSPQFLEPAADAADSTAGAAAADAEAAATMEF